MFTPQRIAEENRVADLCRRHQRFAEVYVEAKMVVREMSYKDMPVLSVPFKPVHLYMHVLPGFNTYFEPACYTGWRRLRKIDVDTDLDNSMNVRFAFSASYLGHRSW